MTRCYLLVYSPDTAMDYEIGSFPDLGLLVEAAKTHAAGRKADYQPFDYYYIIQTPDTSPAADPIYHKLPD